MTTTVLIFAIVALLVVIWAMSVSHKAELFTSLVREEEYYYKLQATEHYYQANLELLKNYGIKNNSLKKQLDELQEEFDAVNMKAICRGAIIDELKSCPNCKGNPLTMLIRNKS